MSSDSPSSGWYLTLPNWELILWLTRGKDEANAASAAMYGVACCFPGLRLSLNAGHEREAWSCEDGVGCCSDNPAFHLSFFLCTMQYVLHIMEQRATLTWELG